MRIAFISHEFPPDTGGGGIGTYLAQVSGWLAEAGHDVEVFCGAAGSAGTQRHANGVVIHRLRGDGAEAFRAAVVPAVTAAHAARAFDVLEANDFDAPALALKRVLPRLPCVVKLHTPRFVIDELHHREPTRAQRWRMWLGALRRGQRLAPPAPIRDQPAAQAELAGLAAADEIAAPSEAIARAAAEWLPAIADRISVFPYPYVPAPELLALTPTGTTGRVTFLGRLEMRKGVLELADAIPHVLAAHPRTRFRFIGRAMPSPEAGLDMQAYLERRLQRHRAQVEFTGPVPPERVRAFLGETDLLVAPSHWESFGLVCCEGLAAARAVVGSANGGMAEILDHGSCGRLVPPGDSGALAQAINKLLAAPAEQIRLGLAGRRRILEHYAASPVLAAQLASYQRAIARCVASPSSS
jgi:glycosyltransferase involved in cell wall biosynthesis